MKVLLSIKPEFALKIFDGSKRYEYRRMIFKQRGVETVVVYASDPVRRVIGEFDVGEILHDKPDQLWAQTCNHAGITKTRFMEYFGNQDKGYAIQIGETRKYETPLAVSDFMLSLPPQSFTYLRGSSRLGENAADSPGGRLACQLNVCSDGRRRENSAKETGDELHRYLANA